MVDVIPIARPQIYLHGTLINGEDFSSRVDHSMTPVVSSSNLIEGTTRLDRDDILSFNNSIRIIITGQVYLKPSYERQSGVLGDRVFEGSKNYETTPLTPVNNLAETYYTLNGKDPVRSSNYLYNFTDMDDIVYDSNDPSFPSGNNLDQLGFVLKVSPTAHDLITLKARTFYQGDISAVALAVFKIVKSVGDNLEIDNEGNNV